MSGNTHTYSLSKISMNNIYSFILILLISFFISSCESKETPISDLDDLIEEISENSEEYSDEDWEEAALQYQHIEDVLEKYQSEYSDKELRCIGEKKGKCLAFFAKRSVKKLQKNMEDLMYEASGIVEGFYGGTK